MSRLEDWLSAVRQELDLPEVDAAAVLDLARDVAHEVARPAAPLTAFLVGVAVGRAGADAVVTRDLIDRVSELARRWPDDGD